MNTQEDYVSLEVAKLLKEKGFPQDPNMCNTAYTFRGNLSNNAKSFVHNFTEFNKLGIKPITYSIAPTLQMAMKWLREVHNVHIDVHLSFSEDPENYPPFYYIYLLDSKSGNSILEKAKTIEELNPLVHKNNTPIGFNSYEKACETAIKYCLEKLI